MAILLTLKLASLMNAPAYTTAFSFLPSKLHCLMLLRGAGDAGASSHTHRRAHFSERAYAQRRIKRGSCSAVIDRWLHKHHVRGMAV
jgi:hypothetical protein